MKKQNKDNGLPPFKEKDVISNSERRTADFLPLYNLDGLIDKGTETKSNVMINLEAAWFDGAMTLFIAKNSTASAYIQQYYPEYANMPNIVILYCLRHTIELGIKSYLTVSNPKASEDSKISHSHNLKQLFDISQIHELFNTYDRTRGHEGDADEIRKFIYWLSSYEESNENKYRYPMQGKNKMLQGNQFINFSRIFDYVYHFSRVITNWKRTQEGLALC